MMRAVGLLCLVVGVVVAQVHPLLPFKYKGGVVLVVVYLLISVSTRWRGGARTCAVNSASLG